MKAAMAGLFRAYVEYYRDPTESLQALVAVGPLTDVKVETDHVAYLKCCCRSASNEGEHGVSAVEPARLEACIRMLEDGFAHPFRRSAPDRSTPMPICRRPASG